MFWGFLSSNLAILNTIGTITLGKPFQLFTRQEATTKYLSWKTAIKRLTMYATKFMDRFVSKCRFECIVARILSCHVTVRWGWYSMPGKFHRTFLLEENLYECRIMVRKTLNFFSLNVFRHSQHSCSLFFLLNPLRSS